MNSLELKEVQITNKQTSRAKHSHCASWVLEQTHQSLTRHFCVGNIMSICLDTWDMNCAGKKMIFECKCEYKCPDSSFLLGQRSKRGEQVRLLIWYGYYMVYSKCVWGEDILILPKMLGAVAFFLHFNSSHVIQRHSSLRKTVSIDYSFLYLQYHFYPSQVITF